MVMLEDFMKTQRVTEDRHISHSSHSVNIGYTYFFFPGENNKTKVTCLRNWEQIFFAEE